MGQVRRIQLKTVTIAKVWADMRNPGGSKQRGSTSTHRCFSINSKALLQESSQDSTEILETERKTGESLPHNTIRALTIEGRNPVQILSLMDKELKVVRKTTPVTTGYR